MCPVCRNQTLHISWCSMQFLLPIVGKRSNKWSAVLNTLRRYHITVQCTHTHTHSHRDIWRTWSSISRIWERGASGAARQATSAANVPWAQICPTLLLSVKHTHTHTHTHGKMGRNGLLLQMLVHSEKAWEQKWMKAKAEKIECFRTCMRNIMNL